MNFDGLKAELAARGFDYLPDNRLGQYINWAIAELDDMHLWPYRLAFAVSTTPEVTITDLGIIRSVIDTANGSQSLPVVQRGELESDFGDLTVAGTPAYAYVVGETVKLFPVGGAITVHYFASFPELTLGTHTPEIPTRFHRLVVDVAVERAYRDSDNHAEAEALRAGIERDLDVMRRALLVQQVTGGQSRIQTGLGFW